MFRNLDFSSWQNALTTFAGAIALTILMLWLRLLILMTIQQRRERENRQINERLRVLMAAYKTLGGSFTGDLAVDPTHLRDLQRRMAEGTSESVEASLSSDRSRRMRDAVEAALSDVILLGTEEQVRLAAGAATELASGKFVHTDELVTSLRNFIRQTLNLEPVPAGVTIPKQGPARIAAQNANKGKNGDDADRGKNKGGDGGGGMGMAGGMGMGIGLGGGMMLGNDEEH